MALQNGILQHKGALSIAELIISKAEKYTLSHSAGCMAAKDNALVPDRDSTVSLAIQESTFFFYNADRQSGSFLASTQN